MLKNFLFLFCFVFVLGCEETLPPIDFGNSNSGDWTYSVLGESDIPAAQDKTIVVEDLTGVRCSNCPQAAETAKKIKDKYPERVTVIGIYPQEPKNLTTPYAGFPDLRTDNSQLIASNLFGFSNQLPGGGINRRLFAGQTVLNIPYNSWLSAADVIKEEKSGINIVLSKISLTNLELIVKTDVIFTAKPVSEPFITVLLLEDSIAHPQTTNSGTDNAYVHKHILRAMFTPYNGSPIFSQITSLAPDRGIAATKTWTLSVPENINTDEATLVVLINYNTENNKEIIQCKELKLK